MDWSCYSHVIAVTYFGDLLAQARQQDEAVSDSSMRKRVEFLLRPCFCLGLRWLCVISASD